MERFEPTITLVSEDARGEIYSINLPGDRELMLLHSKAGTIRGGHSHDVAESVMVLTGELEYSKSYPSVGPSVDTSLLREGDYSQNVPGEVHMGKFPVDSWIIEWKICKNKHSWKNTNYELWRKLVAENAV